jgi:hypothetical protein
MTSDQTPENKNQSTSAPAHTPHIDRNQAITQLKALGCNGGERKTWTKWTNRLTPQLCDCTRSFVLLRFVHFVPVQCYGEVV